MKRFIYVIVSFSGLVYAYLLYQLCFEKIGSFNLEIFSFVLALLFNVFSNWVIFSKRQKWLLVIYLLIQIGIYALCTAVYFEPRSMEILDNKYWLSTIRYNMTLAMIMFFATLFRFIKISLEERRLK